MNHRTKRIGFSLVELVIVVVIIGVIAAIAVPRISRGARGASDSAVKGSLASLRNAIDVYAAEHGGTFPGPAADDVVAQLTKKTDFSGNVGTTAGTHIYGPYLRGHFPPLPVSDNSGATDVLIDKTNTPPVPVPSATEGWVYNPNTGEILANCADTDVDEQGTKYNTY